MDASPTFGQRAVGLSYTPVLNETGAILRQSFAEIIDQLDSIRSTSKNTQAIKAASMCIMKLQDVCEMSFEAVNKKDL